MSEYTISREGQPLGSFGLPQIQEGLQTGFFQSTDWGWQEGMADWQPLHTLTGSTRPVASKPQPRPVASPQSAAVRRTAESTGSLNPYAAPASKALGSTALGAVPMPVIAELSGTKPWVRFISVLMWIVSVLFLLAILGNLVFGIMGASALAQQGQAGAGFGALAGMMIFCGVTAMLVIYPTLKLSKYASGISRLAESQSFTDLTAALAEQRRFWKFYGIITMIYFAFAALFVILMIAGVGLGAMAR